MITTELRYHLTIDTIEYSDTYEENYDLFNQGIQILKQRLKTQNFEEFNVEEQTILEEIFTIMNGE